MPTTKSPRALSLVAAALAMTSFLVSSPAAAQTETVLHNFGGSDGAYPGASLTRDSAGNLYSTTGEGGVHNLGAVFEMSPKAGGGYSERVLHSFNSDGVDGIYPDGNVILDASGNLYGTTSAGGTGTCGTSGCGVVFELAQRPGGGWAERIIYSFKNNGTDGSGPLGTLIFDTSGNLYGAASGGGAYGNGAVFELSPRSGGVWTERLLHSFRYDGSSYLDGDTPGSGLTLDAAGNLYGTTTAGGSTGNGTVFELTRGSGGTWTEQIVFSFNGPDGANPTAAVIFDAAGNIYGTTALGGLINAGTVFELTPSAGGGWSESLLHLFSSNGTDGITPQGGVIFDASGNLYGTTTSSSQSSAPNGTVYKLTPSSGGTWSEEIFFHFNRTGGSPEASLLLDSSGNLYGTTAFGGAHNDGTVFEITP